MIDRIGPSVSHDALSPAARTQPARQAAQRPAASPALGADTNAPDSDATPVILRDQSAIWSIFAEARQPAPVSPPAEAQEDTPQMRHVRNAYGENSE